MRNMIYKKSYLLDNQNIIEPFYKIDQNKLIYTFNDLRETANLIKNIVPFSKVALLFKGEAKEEDIVLYNTIKEKGLKPVCYYFKENFTADLKHFSGLFHLPEDMRAVLTCEPSLSSAVNYFATVRKIPAFFVLDEHVSIQPFSDLIFICNERQISKFYFDCERRVAVADGCWDKEKTFLSITLNTFSNLLDYNLNVAIKNTTCFSEKYNAVKSLLINLVENFYKNKTLESVIKVVASQNELIKENPNNTSFFTFLESVGFLHKLSDFERVMVLEQIFKFILDDKHDVSSNYSHLISLLSFVFNVDVAFVLRSFKGLITGLNNTFINTLQIKEEIFYLYKLFLKFKKDCERCVFSKNK